MRKRLILLILFGLISAYPLSAQDEENRTYQISSGIGHTQFADNNITPSGVYGLNYSILLNKHQVRKVNKKSLSLLNFQFSYSKLGRNDGVQSLAYPSYLFDLSLKNEWLYNIAVNKKLHAFIGFNAALTGYYYYYILPYKEREILYNCGSWNVSVGLSQLFSYNFGKFKLENHWNIPLLFFGFFLDYQYPTEYIELSFLFTNTKFVSISNYVQFNNHFSIEYPLFKNKKSLCSLRFTYFFSRHRSEVNEIIVQDRKHTFLIGIVFKRKDL